MCAGLSTTCRAVELDTSFRPGSAWQEAFYMHDVYSSSADVIRLSVDEDAHLTSSGCACDSSGL